MYHEPLRTRGPRGLDDAGIAAGGCATACPGEDRIWRAAWNESGVIGIRVQSGLPDALLSCDAGPRISA